MFRTDAPMELYRLEQSLVPALGCPPFPGTGKASLITGGVAYLICGLGRKGTN